MQAYLRYTKFILVFVFLIILAGGVVRTTQSGMGCPDWPTCFGMWVPPTSASQLPPDFEKYLGLQDIDHSFNALHTWTEYINRLLSALIGLFILLHLAWSYRKFFKINRNIFWLSFAMLIITMLEAWLGKEVVNTNLQVVKITIHMLGALVLAFVPVIIINKLEGYGKINDVFLKNMVSAALIILLVQIFFGTDVREQVDTISKKLAYEHRNTWLVKTDYFFDIHKTLSIVVTFFCVFIFWRSLQYPSIQKKAMFILVALLCLIALGLVMTYINIPAFAQPLHLLFSSILFVLLFSLRLRLT
jgi:heme a synthase